MATFLSNNGQFIAWKLEICSFCRTQGSVRDIGLGGAVMWVPANHAARLGHGASGWAAP